MPEQIWPEELKRTGNETLIEWRDRVFHEYRIPVVLAALTDLKCSYVEVVNPLLTRGINEQIRELADNARMQKEIFKKIVSEMSPPIPFASLPSTIDTNDFFESKKIVEPIADELNSSYCRATLSSQFVDYILSNLTIGEPRSNRLRRLSKSIRFKMRRNFIKSRFNINQLAFRVYVISNMTRILNADAECLRKTGRAISSVSP